MIHRLARRVARRIGIGLITIASATAVIMPATAAAAGSSVLAAPPGYGGPNASCGGSLVDVEPLSSSSGSTSGSFMDVSYSTANGGTVCAMVYDNINGSHYMSVNIRRSDWVTDWDDTGTFTTYAGAVEVYGAAGKCIFLYGQVTINGVPYYTKFGITGSAAAPICWVP